MSPKPNTTMSRAQSDRSKPRVFVRMSADAGLRRSSHTRQRYQAATTAIDDGDERFDDRAGHRHEPERGEDERDRVRDRERGRHEHDVAQASGPDDEGEEEEDVVDAEQQVLGAEHEEVREPLDQRLLGVEERGLTVERGVARASVEVVLEDRDSALHVFFVVGEERAAELVCVGRLAREVECQHGVGDALPLGHVEVAHPLGVARGTGCRHFEPLRHVVGDLVRVGVERNGLIARLEHVHPVLEELRGVLEVRDGDDEQVVLELELGANRAVLWLRGIRVHHGREAVRLGRCGRRAVGRDHDGEHPERERDGGEGAGDGVRGSSDSFGARRWFRPG